MRDYYVVVGGAADGANHPSPHAEVELPQDRLVLLPRSTHGGCRVYARRVAFARSDLRTECHDAGRRLLLDKGSRPREGGRRRERRGGRGGECTARHRKTRGLGESKQKVDGHRDGAECKDGGWLDWRRGTGRDACRPQVRPARRRVVDDQHAVDRNRGVLAGNAGMLQDEGDLAGVASEDDLTRWGLKHARGHQGQGQCRVTKRDRDAGWSERELRWEIKGHLLAGVEGATSHKRDARAADEDEPAASKMGDARVLGKNVVARKNDVARRCAAHRKVLLAKAGNHAGLVSARWPRKSKLRSPQARPPNMRRWRGRCGGRGRRRGRSSRPWIIEARATRP